MRCLFTMFAEDVRLIPDGSFTDFLTRMQKRPENFAPNLSSLWQAMDKGEFSPAAGRSRRNRAALQRLSVQGYHRDPARMPTRSAC